MIHTSNGPSSTYQLSLTYFERQPILRPVQVSQSFDLGVEYQGQINGMMIVTRYATHCHMVMYEQKIKLTYFERQ